MTSRSFDRPPTFRRTVGAALIFAALGGWTPGFAQSNSAADAMALAGEAAQAAAQAKDLPVYLEKMEAAVALRPDFPQLLMNLAAAQVANGKLDEAIATLERAAKLGVTGAVGKSEELAALRGRKDFEAIVRRFATNGHPQGRGEIAFALRDVTGLIEGIAWREGTREFFFSDVNGRAIWRRNKDNTLRRFTPEGDELLGVFGIVVDEPRGALWAATSAVSAMRGFTPEQDGAVALVEIDLESGAIRRSIALPAAAEAGHLFEDVALGGDGAVFVSDSVGATIWRLAGDGNSLERVAQGGELMSPQGMVVLADGALVVADRVSGLIRIALPDGGTRRIEPPSDWTLVGIDGLARAPNGDLLAIQSSTAPKRVLRIALDPGAEKVSQATVLESGHLTMSGPTLGCVAQDGDFYFIGNAGWSRFASSEGKPSAPRPVPVFRTKLSR